MSLFTPFCLLCALELWPKYLRQFSLIVLKHAVLCRSVTSASETLWTVVSQAPVTAGFSQEEYWSGWPFPSPRDLPNPGIEPASLASPALAGRLFTTEPPRKSSGSEEGSLRRIFQR